MKSKCTDRERISLAIWNKDWGRVRSLILAGAEDDFDYDYKDFPLIFKLIDKGQEELAILWLEQGYPIDAVGGRRREGLLQYAIAKGLSRLVKKLIAAGASINRLNYSGESPLWTASRHGESDFVRLLLQAGADPDGFDFEDRPDPDYPGTIHKDTPLAVAANAEIAHLLLDAGASYDIKMYMEFSPSIDRRFNLVDEEASPLVRACMDGRMDTARTFMRLGAMPDNQVLRFMAAGDTRLAEADILEIIRTGVDPDGEPGKEPLLIAALAGKTEFCRALLKAGARPLPEALDLAVLSGEDDCVIYLINEGIGNPDSALRLAARWRRNNILHWLMENTMANKAYALFGAIEGSRWDLAESLLQQELDVNTRDENGKTPLMTLFELDRRKTTWEAMRLFPRRYKAQWPTGRFQYWWPDMEDFDFVQAFMAQPTNWNELVDIYEEDVMELAKSLIKNGADLQARDNLGRSALWQACRQCYWQSIPWLVDMGGCLCERDNEGINAFEAGCLTEERLTFKAMMECGYAIDSQDENGDTALLKLARRAEKYHSGIYFLLSKGANPDLENKHGQSFRKMAIEKDCLKWTLDLREMDN